MYQIDIHQNVNSYWFCPAYLAYFRKVNNHTFCLANKRLFCFIEMVKMILTPWKSWNNTMDVLKSLFPFGANIIQKSSSFFLIIHVHQINRMLMNQFGFILCLQKYIVYIYMLKQNVFFLNMEFCTFKNLLSFLLSLTSNHYDNMKSKK